MGGRYKQQMSETLHTQNYTHNFISQLNSHTPLPWDLTSYINLTPMLINGHQGKPTKHTLRDRCFSIEQTD